MEGQVVKGLKYHAEKHDVYPEGTNKMVKISMQGNVIKFGF